MPLIAGAAAVLVAALRGDQDARRRSAATAALGMEEDPIRNQLEVLQLLSIPGPWEDGLPALTWTSTDYVYRVKVGDRPGMVLSVYDRLDVAGMSMTWGAIQIGGVFFRYPDHAHPDGIYPEQGVNLTEGLHPDDPRFWESAAGIDLTREDAASLTRAVQDASVRLARRRDEFPPRCSRCDERYALIRTDSDCYWQFFCKACSDAAGLVLADIKSRLANRGIRAQVIWIGQDCDKVDGVELIVQGNFSDEDVEVISAIVGAHGGVVEDPTCFSLLYVFPARRAQR